VTAAFNRRASAFATYGNSAELNVTYGDVCLVVRIGNAGDRLGYRRVAPKEQDKNERDYYSGAEEELVVPPAHCGWWTTKYGLKK